MRLYEIDITSLWWIAASDEMEAMNVLREELYVLEVPDEEMDAVMDDLLIREVYQDDAETISVPDDGDCSEDSLWNLYLLMPDAGVVYTDYHRDEDEDEDEDEEEIDYGIDGNMPEDWM